MSSDHIVLLERLVYLEDTNGLKDQLLRGGGRRKIVTSIELDCLDPAHVLCQGLISYKATHDPWI